MTLHKTIKLDNQGGSDETYDASYQATTVVPGATYSVSPSQVTVPAGSSATVTLTLTIDPTKLTKTVDPTMAPRTNVGVGSLPREFLADASGLVMFAPGDGSPTLRVPVYSAPRPASVMTQPASPRHAERGHPDSSRCRSAAPGSARDPAARRFSRSSSGFELQATSGALPACGALTTGCIHASDESAADLKYVGTTSNAPELQSIGDDPLAYTPATGACNADGQCGLEYFAISTQGPWHTAATENEYDIYIDVNGDGTPDFIVFNTRLVGGTAPDDVIVVNLVNHLQHGQGCQHPVDQRPVRRHGHRSVRQ